eukprot:1511988-Amphidinium_carterae.1
MTPKIWPNSTRRSQGPWQGPSKRKTWSSSKAPAVPIKGALARRTAASLRTNVCERVVTISSRAHTHPWRTANLIPDASKQKERDRHQEGLEEALTSKTRHKRHIAKTVRRVCLSR